MKRSLAAFLILFALLMAFSFLNFRLMSSETARDGAVAVSHQSSINGSSVQVPDLTVLRVEGKGRLAQRVGAALLAKLQAEAVPGAFVLAGNTNMSSEAAALIVTLDEQSYFWSPVHARARVVAEAAYASNGDLSFREQDPPHFRSTEGEAAVQFLGRYALADTSSGLISRPGYQDYLAKQIADAIAASVKEETGRAVVRLESR